MKMMVMIELYQCLVIQRVRCWIWNWKCLLCYQFYPLFIDGDGNGDDDAVGDGDDHIGDSDCNGDDDNGDVKAWT